MRFQRIAGIGSPLYIWPDRPGRMVPGAAIAGPFDTVTAARWFQLERVEASFTETQKALWSDACFVASAAPVDVAHMLGVAILVALGRSREFVMKCASAKLRAPEQHDLLPSVRHDVKMLAAGEGRST